jgi:hypothetical protein
VSDVKRQVAGIDARVLALGARHAKALAEAMRHPPAAGVKMSWRQQRKVEKYRKASLALLASRPSANSTMRAATCSMIF